MKMKEARKRKGEIEMKEGETKRYYIKANVRKIVYKLSK
jgi:hypothetical protein